MNTTDHKNIQAMIAVDSLCLKSNDIEWLNMIADRIVKANPLAAEFLAQHINAKLASK